MCAMYMCMYVCMAPTNRRTLAEGLVQRAEGPADELEAGVGEEAAAVDEELADFLLGLGRRGEEECE